MKRKRWLFGLAALMAGVPALWFAAAWLAPFPAHRLESAPRNLRLLDAEGGLLRRTLSAEGFDADWVPLADAGEWAAAALISVEDRRFHRHLGVDPLAVARAAMQNLRRGRVVSGASTISIQVIRLIEPRPRTLRTKLIEAFRATQLELRYDKAFILEQYLNRAPFGGNRQGIAAAARRYFGKEPRHLSAGEAALLMGLPQSPTRLRPDRHPARAEQRRATVLRRMRAAGAIDGDPLLDSGPRWHAPPFRAPHFTDWILRRHRGRTGSLQTTIDPRMQRLLEEVAGRFRRDPRYADLDGIGLVLMDARSGAIRGWVGGWDRDHPGHGQVDAVTRRRAPGSTLKPFAYALAMQQGWLTPDLLIEDRPRSFQGYRPRNMDGLWDGEVSATDALVRSLNLPALGLIERIGAPRFLDTLRDAGLALPGVRAEETGIGAVIGGGVGVHLLELVGAYSAFANEGARVVPHGVAEEARAAQPLFHPGVAYWITEMLGGAERDLSLYGNMADAARPRIAFKTGTSHGYRDAWAIGWNVDWVVGVWLGRMDNRGFAGLGGASHAAPVLGAIARELFRPDAFPAPPPELREWRGRQIIAGITDHSLPPTSPARLRIVSPAPDLEWHVFDEGPARIPLRAVGPGRGHVHWFLDGAWLGAWPADETRAVSVRPGVRHVRAVYADGQSASVRVQIKSIAAPAAG